MLPGVNKAMKLLFTFNQELYQLGLKIDEV